MDSSRRDADICWVRNDGRRRDRDFERVFAAVDDAATTSPPDTIVFMHATVKEPEAVFACLVEPLVEETHDLTLGSRFVSDSIDRPSHRPRIYGVGLLRYLFRRLFGVRFTDPLPDFAIEWKAFESLRMDDADGNWLAEFLIRSAIVRLRSHEIRVNDSRRPGRIGGEFRQIINGAWKFRHWRTMHTVRR